ncbi:MAG: hypothetical protein HUJ29_04640 [Gammaproteobacteria bacterium]|nr:hypothetical protein [Gammaproteobacteria bacterium]
MSAIGGSCGPTQSELLIQQGLQQAQASNIQQRRDFSEQTLQSLSNSPIAAPFNEPNKGLNIDVYA